MSKVIFKGYKNQMQQQHVFHINFFQQVFNNGYNVFCGPSDQQYGL